MSFSDQVRAFSLRVEAKHRAQFQGIAAAVLESVAYGSAVTGSPGQPVDTGTLRGSWQLRFPSASEAIISTNIVYAPTIEAGERAVGRGNATGHTTQRLTLRSEVGGFHSLAMTVAEFPALVAAEVARSGR